MFRFAVTLPEVRLVMFRWAYDVLWTHATEAAHKVTAINRMVRRIRRRLADLGN
jgi:hypothetical protein